MVLVFATFKLWSIVLSVLLLLNGVTSVEKGDLLDSELFVLKKSPMRTQSKAVPPPITKMSILRSLDMGSEDNPFSIPTPTPSTDIDTLIPSVTPTIMEISQPSASPSLNNVPSSIPTSLAPSIVPSSSFLPTLAPTTFEPTLVPSISIIPSASPTWLPTISPTHQRVVQEPMMHPAGGSGVMVIYVTLECGFPSDATIYYTLDGTKPSDSSMVYSTGVPLPLYADDCEPTCTLKAVAYKDHWRHSSIVSNEFDVKHMVDPPILDPFVGTYVGFVNVQVFVKDAISASVRYTTNVSESLGEGLVDANGKSLDGYKGLQVKNGHTIQLQYSGDKPGSQQVQLKCMGVKEDYAPSTIVVGEYFLLAQSPPPLFTPDYEEPQPLGAYLAMAVDESFPHPTTIYWTTDGTDPYVPGSYTDEGSVVSPSQRSCNPSNYVDKHCEVHVDMVGVTLFKAVSQSQGFQPSIVSTKSIEVQARCEPPTFEVLSTSSQTTQGGSKSETFTSSVTFQFACLTKGDDVLIEYEVVGAVGTGSGTTVGLGVEIVWKQLGTVTIVARSTKLGMFDSADVEETFVIIEPSYEVHPMQSVLFDMSSQLNREELLRVDPSVPSLSVQPFEKLVRDHNLQTNCEIMLRGIRVVIPQPERFLSVVPPSKGKLTPSVLSSSLYRHTGVPPPDQFAAHSFSDRPHWLVEVDGLSNKNISDMVARSWANELSWSSYHTQPIAGAEQQWSPFSGCSLAVSGGLSNLTSKTVMGHLVSDGLTLQVEDGQEYVNNLGVRREEFIGVDFGVRNHSFVVGYVPANEVETHNHFSQLLTGEVWLVRKSKVYVFESLAHSGVDAVYASEFANQRLGRTAWGHDSEGKLMVVSIEGLAMDDDQDSEDNSPQDDPTNDDDDEAGVEDVCEEDGSRGATLLELARLMLDLGCVNAVSGAGGTSEMSLNGVRVGGGMSQCSDQAQEGAKEDSMRWQCSTPASALLCVHMAPPPVIELTAKNASLFDAALEDLLWPWSSSRHPTLTPSSSISRAPTTIPTPTRSPTRAPIPQPTMKQLVIGSDDDFYSPLPNNLMDDMEMLNGTTVREEDPETAFYKTSTMMLLITLILSGFLHLWTWNNQVKEQERRARDGDDYLDDGTGNRSNKLRAPPVISYGGNSYGTKVATSPIAALKELARRSTRKRQPRGYALVNGAGVEDGEYDEADDGMEMVDTVIHGRGGIFNRDDEEDIIAPPVGHVPQQHVGADGGDDEDEDDDEDFETRFKRLDSRHEALSIGRVVKGLLPPWLGGGVDDDDTGRHPDELPRWKSMSTGGSRGRRRKREPAFDMEVTASTNPLESSAHSAGTLEVEVNPFALINEKGGDRRQMYTPRMVAIRAQQD